MEVEIILLGVLVVIAGAVAGVYIGLMLNRARVEKLDRITKCAWVAVRAARDTVKQDGRGTDKFNYAITVMRKWVSGGDIIENAVRAAYQNMKLELG